MIAALIRQAGAWRSAAMTLGGVACLCACTPDAVLLSDLSANDAFTIQHVLAEAAVPTTARTGKDGRIALSVSRDRQDAARGVLLEQGLPRPEFQSFGDVFANDGMLTSPFEERARYLYASSQGLENTLRNIEGVLFAKVHLVMPETKSLMRESVPASASVFLKYRLPSKVATMHTALQRLVANAIPGLSPERVVVVATAVDGAALGADVAFRGAGATPVGDGGYSASRIAMTVGSHLLALCSGAGAVVLGRRWPAGRGGAWPGWPSAIARTVSAVRVRKGRTDKERGA